MSQSAKATSRKTPASSTPGIPDTPKPDEKKASKYPKDHKPLPKVGYGQ